MLCFIFSLLWLPVAQLSHLLLVLAPLVLGSLVGSLRPTHLSPLPTSGFICTCASLAANLACAAIGAHHPWRPGFIRGWEKWKDEEIVIRAQLC